MKQFAFRKDFTGRICGVDVTVGDGFVPPDAVVAEALRAARDGHRRKRIDRTWHLLDVSVSAVTSDPTHLRLHRDGDDPRYSFDRDLWEPLPNAKRMARAANNYHSRSIRMARAVNTDFTVIFPIIQNYTLAMAASALAAHIRSHPSLPYLSTGFGWPILEYEVEPARRVWMEGTIWLHL